MKTMAWLLDMLDETVAWGLKHPITSILLIVACLVLGVVIKIGEGEKSK